MLRIVHCFTIFYVIVLVLLLELPSVPPEIDPVPEPLAICKHLAALTLLGFFVELGRTKKSMFFWVSLLLLFAIGTEFLQGLLQPICNRIFDWHDMFHNILGVCLGMFIGHFCRPLAQRLDKREKNPKTEQTEPPQQNKQNRNL